MAAISYPFLPPKRRATSKNSHEVMAEYTINRILECARCWMQGTNPTRAHKPKEGHGFNKEERHVSRRHAGTTLFFIALRNKRV